MTIMRFLKLILSFFLITAFILPNFELRDFEARAETSDSLQICESIEEIDKECKILSPSDCRQLLENCQKYFEEKSFQIAKDITKTEQEKKTLQSQISVLTNKIKNLGYQISQSNLVIRDLGLQIKDTENSIEKTSLKISQSSEKLIFILRTIYEEDERSVVEIFLTEPRLSDFFDDLVALEALSVKNKDLLKNIKEMKTYLESQRQSLDEEKQDLENLVVIQTLQKKESEETKEEREYFLKLTEAEYQKYLKEKEETEKRTAAIRARIYELIGVRKAVTYEEALEIAKYAASQVGIRSALLLGVLSQESKIGQNVGQCFLKNPKTGEGIRVQTGTATSRVMNPQRDVPYFLEIVKELNEKKNLDLNPYETLVSCPMSFGWGGAMGPAQFIPDTWANPKYGYKKRVEEITGSAADPWDIRDASLAASLYLKDGLNRYGTEGKAVQAYFCGSPTGTYWCRWYETNVLQLASCHQSFINTGSMSSKCEDLIF